MSQHPTLKLLILNLLALASRWLLPIVQAQAQTTFCFANNQICRVDQPEGFPLRHHT